MAGNLHCSGCMLSWRKMRCRLGEILILLTVALVVRNAQCFAHCLAEPGESGAAHCHQHGREKSGHCVMQHDLTADSARAVTPKGGLSVAPIELPVLPINPTG